MKKWQIENSETSEISEISEILFRVFLFPSFRFCPIAKIRVFRVFDLATISCEILRIFQSNFLLGCFVNECLSKAVRAKIMK